MIWPENSLFFEHPNIYGVSFDSRFVKKGDLFIALSGSNFDGHNFVKEAMKNGAVCALVEHPICSDNIVVNSCLDTFIKIAKLRRSLFAGKIIAITGSVGKSTFRSSLVNSLSSSFFVQTPIKNHNTLVGLSNFFSQFDLSSDFLVVELGIDSIGDMELLADLTAPDYSILTNISSAHSFCLGSLFSILLEKSKIFDYTSSHAFFSNNIWYSDFLISKMVDLELSFSCFDFDINSRLLMSNISSSLFSVLNLDLPFSITEIAGRRDIFSFRDHEISFSVIDSAYNSNLSSLINELSFFKSFSTRKKIAILGDMWGFSSRHHEILSLFCYDFQCWLVGPNMYFLSLILPNSIFFDSLDSLIGHVKFFIHTAEVDSDFLIKGSNCMNLVQVVYLLHSY